VVPAKEIMVPAILPEMDPLNEADGLRQWKVCDLLIVEDLQYLAKRSSPVLAELIDNFQARQAPVVVTASMSPRELNVAFRLSSRLTGGLVVELQYPGVSSRFAILQQKTQERQLAVSREVITWLAEHLKGGRELEGAVTKLELISRAKNNVLDIATIASHFQEDDRAAQPSIERIVQKVSGYFRIPRWQLSSGTRNRHVVLPRQLGMYLSRRLTDLSLQEIGTHFGGRDHTTVLHACRKVETALRHDAALAGTVQQLRAELT
jgi:chromosomal replication initiator protein